ncbi:exo-beta-N-acetylmuramidase NamZ domain-containing protein [Micromonospora sp. NPDC048830]|uniref:exo-beta-N-acetylmuramidase NamZ domain-containing protein n=1 Tax=Micromonospora sp. NPDC048830 TaxID=3364257 RepID=UPI003717CB4E
MHGSGQVDLAAAFGPEHGFRGSAQAGGSEGSGTDARTGITVHDAYGASQARWEAMFTESGTDTVVFDIRSTCTWCAAGTGSGTRSPPTPTCPG